MKKSNSIINFMNGILLAILFYIVFSPISVFIAGSLALFALLATLGVFKLEAGVLGTNYVPSALAKAQAKLLGMFQAGELRVADPVTYKAFVRNSTIMFPDAKELRTREDRTLEAYYKIRTSRSLGSARVHNPSGVTGDSAALAISYSTYSDKFSNSMKQGDNNVFSNDEMFANEVENVIKNFSEGNETTATNYLHNNRSQVNNAVAEGTFNATTYVFEINESTVGNRAVQITTSAMAENKYGNLPMTIFCDSIAFNKFDFLSKQGQTNATNTSFQFGGQTFVRSLQLTAKAAALGYTKGYWVVGADGMFGLLDWIPKQNRTGVQKAPYNYASFLNPIDGLNYAVFYTYVAQDSTTVGGYTQDILTNYEFSIDLAFEKAPLSTSNEQIFQAFGLV